MNCKVSLGSDQPYGLGGLEGLRPSLALPPDIGCEEVRLRVRRVRHALERLRERPISPALRAQEQARSNHGCAPRAQAARRGRARLEARGHFRPPCARVRPR